VQTFKDGSGVVNTEKICSIDSQGSLITFLAYSNVLHGVLYPRHTEMDLKKNFLAGQRLILFSERVNWTRSPQDTARGIVSLRSHLTAFPPYLCGHLARLLFLSFFFFFCRIRFLHLMCSAQFFVSAAIHCYSLSWTAETVLTYRFHHIF
jgi:hypothetical protein